MKKKITLLFAALLSFVGITQVMAQKALPYSYGFENNDLAADGWTKYLATNITNNNKECGINTVAKKTGSYGFRFSSANVSGTNAQYLISPELNGSNGVNVSFYYKSSNTGDYGTESFKVGYSTTDTDVNSFTWDEEIRTSAASWLLYENSFPAGTKYVAIYYYSNYKYRLYVDDFSFTAPANGPALAVADGLTTINSGYNYNFGLTTPGTPHYFTLSNPGTEAITLNIEATNGFSTDNTNLTLDAKASCLLHVLMADATSTGTVTITPTASGIDPFVINVSGTVADPNKVFETLLTGSKPEDWTTSGTWSWSTTNGAANTAYYESYNYRIITPKLTVADGETFFFDARGTYNGYQGVKFEYSADGTNWTASSTTTTLTSDWQTFTISDIPAGQYYIALHGWQCNIRNFYGGELPNEPKMVVTQPSSLDFGVITEATAKTFTIANTGKATLEGISVESTNSEIFAVTGVPSTLAAGESAAVTITMVATTTGSLSSDITVSATDMTDVQFTVTGVVLPANMAKEEFNGTTIPTGWTSSGSWSFATEGVATGTGSSAYLYTPKLQFSTGDIVVIKCKNSDNMSGDHLYITGSNDNGSTYSNSVYYKDIALPSSNAEWSTYVITDIPVTVNKLRFTGYYVIIDEISGLTFSADAPVLGYYTDSECTVAATATVTKDFGFLTEAPAAQVYYLKNDGTGTMSIALGDVPASFTAALGVASLAAGESTTLTINMPAETKGYHGGDIVVTATSSSNEQIGTFTVSASGVMMEEGKLNLNFTTTDVIPSTWIATDWSKNNNGYYRGGYSSTTMTTSALRAAAGEEIVIVAKQEYASGSFSVNYKKVDAEEWGTLISSTSLGNSNWAILHAPIAEAGEYKLQIIGNYYTQIQRIYGLTTLAVPFMENTAADMAFGMQTAESAEQSFTISNTGDAVLTGLSLTLGKTGDDAQYSFRMTDSEGADFTGTEIAVGQTIFVYVKQLFGSNFGSKSDVLTISADGQATKTINLTGTTRDGSALYVDFDDPNSFPAGWQTGANWSVYTYGSDRYAYQSSNKTASALVTTPLTVEGGQSLSFKVSRNGSGYGYTTSLKTRYSQDGGATWSGYVAQYGSDSSNEAGSGWTTIELNELPAGDLIFEFYGNNIKLDMIQGLKVATAPALALTESGAAVENGSMKDFGNLSADGVATYTLKNTGNDVLKSTITGEGVTVSPASVELAAGETAEITVTMAFVAPYGEKAGKMTIDSEGWVGDMVVNYTATLVDPTDFVEDFSAGKPAGWYSEGWTYTTVNGNAYVYSGVNKPMITERVGAESGKNVLTFDAKVYSGDGEQTLSVYTSTDRKNWTEAKTVTLTSDVQKVTLDALADGNYYVKFEASNAVVDNIKGVKKLDAPEHDLYVTTATLPTGTPYVGTEISTSATVTSLRADETGVYAKLFVDGVAVATADAADITANGTKTFSMSYTPAATGSHNAYIEVYYNDNTVAFTTLSSVFEVENYPALVFDETLSEPLDFTTGNYDIMLTRTFVAGWNTICLPFVVNVSDIHSEAVAYSFDAYNKDTQELTFNKTTELSAGKPYIIYVPESVTSPYEFKKHYINDLYINAGASTHGLVTFQGTYAPIAKGEMTGKYGVANQADGARIAKAGANASMKGFRAFFELPAGVEIKALTFQDTETGVQIVRMNADEAQEIFDLGGRKLNEVRKGVNIVNGKKMFVK